MKLLHKMSPDAAPFEIHALSEFELKNSMPHSTRQLSRRSPYDGLIDATRRIVLTCLALGGLSAHAADLALPNAGTLLQDLRSQPEVSTPAGDSPLRALPTPDAGMPHSDPFEVRQLLITGNTLFDTATLHALVARLEGQRLTLGQLNEAIGTLTEYYRRAGYPLARAIIPAQTIEAGKVTIQIVEARLGEILLDNQSQVDSAFLQQTLSALQRGEVIHQGALDRALLQLSDVPGIVPGALLKPGEAVGTTDLALDIAPGPRFIGDALLDNYGGRYTGRERLGANLQWYNPLHRGDVLGVSALSSGSRLNYGRMSYEIPLDGQGSYLGAAVSSVQYSLGDTAANLQAHGSAQQGSVWLRHNLLRKPAASVGLRLQYDPVTLRDDVDTTSTQSHRQVELWSLELQAQASDSWLGNAYTNANVALRVGNLGFDHAAAESSDALTAQTRGKFTHWGLNLARTQAVGPVTRVSVSFNGQWAQGNLDASQKFSVGGARSVRAYESGVLSGDSGQAATVELRHLLTFPPASAGLGQWTAVAFVDAGQVQINQNPWGSGSNQAYISGAGVGLDWQSSAKWHARMYIARALALAPSQLEGSPSTHSNAWMEIGMDF